MKTDAYLKTVLTVIAICLVYLCVKDVSLIQNVNANEPSGTLFNKANYGLVPLNEDGSITVKFDANQEMDVNITDISTYDKLNVDISKISTSDELDINIEEVSGYSINGKLKVDISEISTNDVLDINIDEVNDNNIIGGRVPVETN